MRVVGAITVVVVLAAMVSGGSAFGFGAASAPAGGAIYIHATRNDGPIGSIVVTGAIGDYGKTLSIDRNGKANENGNYAMITLTHGTFEVDATALNAKMGQAQSFVNRPTCSFRYSASAPVTLFNGTGLYGGLRGKALITLVFGGVGSAYKSGPNKGQCNQNNDSPLAAQYVAYEGPGTVSF